MQSEDVSGFTLELHKKLEVSEFGLASELELVDGME